MDITLIFTQAGIHGDLSTIGDMDTLLTGDTTNFTVTLTGLGTTQDTGMALIKDTGMVGTEMVFSEIITSTGLKILLQMPLIL
jgi:hypothetical protein